MLNFSLLKKRLYKTILNLLFSRCTPTSTLFTLVRHNEVINKRWYFEIITILIKLNLFKSKVEVKKLLAKIIFTFVLD